MKEALDWIFSERVTDQQDKGKTYWIDEIAFLAVSYTHLTLPTRNCV